MKGYTAISTKVVVNKRKNVRNITIILIVILNNYWMRFL